MKSFIIAIVRLYQNTISPDTGILIKIGLKKPRTCAFYPSCSEYCIFSIKKYGVLRGGKLSLKRFLRCHPWQEGGIDLPK